MLRLLTHNGSLCLPPILILALILTQLTHTFGQEKNAHLRFEVAPNPDCASSLVCYNLQIKSDPGEVFEFGSANLRMFFDSTKLVFQSIQCQLNELYNCGNLSIYPTMVDSIWGMEAGQYLTYNISGVGVPGFGVEITDQFYTFAQICFLSQDSLLVGEDYCESLVWDKLEGTNQGWQQGDGIVFQEQGPEPFVLLSLSEQPEQHNWVYTSNSTGVPQMIECISWPCGVGTCTNFVSNTYDSGFGSLRSAIACADQGDTIQFSVNLIGDTIFLSSSKIVISKDLTIHNAHSSPVTIESMILGALDILEGHTVKFQNIQIMSGVGGIPAAIHNAGVLKLENTTIRRNPFLPSDSNVLVLNQGQIEIQGTVEIFKY